MQANLPILFDFSKLDKRKTPKQKDFEEVNLQLLVKFKEIVFEAFEKLHRKVFSMFEPTDMDRNLPAVSMISFIRQGIIRNFPNYCRKATKKRFKLITPNNDWVFVKKLDEGLRPLNIDTRENSLILNQLTSDVLDKGGNIFLGYTSTPDYSRITGIYAVCIIGNEIEWVSDIAALATKRTAILRSIKTKGQGPRIKEGVTKIKRAKRE